MVSAALALRERGHETPFAGDGSVQRSLRDLGVAVEKNSPFVAGTEPGAVTLGQVLVDPELLHAGLTLAGPAPRASSCSIISITWLLFTIARTLNQPASSSLLIVGDSKPGVIFSASRSFASGTLYSNSE